jgi:hypothetical protein
VDNQANNWRGRGSRKENKIMRFLLIALQVLVPYLAGAVVGYKLSINRRLALSVFVAAIAAVLVSLFLHPIFWVINAATVLAMLSLGTFRGSLIRALRDARNSNDSGDSGTGDQK